MKSEPEFQGQHKISQVYLKQFGYKVENDWFISVYECGTKNTSNLKISEFTKEVNVFDLPYSEPELKRSFENKSNIIENKYNTVISNIKNQKRLAPKDKDVLNHYVANIMCRTNPFRSWIDSLLRDSKKRDVFIEQMTMFDDDAKDTKLSLDILKIDFQLNIAVGVMMDYLVHVFRSFHKVVLKSPEIEGWLTTDSPVHIDFQKEFQWIIPIETEIYFPLSRDYLLFMYHPKSEKNTNQLRKLRVDKVHSLEFNLFDDIAKRVAFDFDKYLILNTYTPDTILKNV